MKIKYNFILAALVTCFMTKTSAVGASSSSDQPAAETTLARSMVLTFSGIGGPLKSEDGTPIEALPLKESLTSPEAFSAIIKHVPEKSGAENLALLDLVPLLPENTAVRLNEHGESTANVTIVISETPLAKLSHSLRETIIRNEGQMIEYDKRAILIQLFGMGVDDPRLINSLINRENLPEVVSLFNITFSEEINYGSFMVPIIGTFEYTCFRSNNKEIKRTVEDVTKLLDIAGMMCGYYESGFAQTYMTDDEIQAEIDKCLETEIDKCLDTYEGEGLDIYEGSIYAYRGDDQLWSFAEPRDNKVKLYLMQQIMGAIKNP